jgi:hypothetical protein
MPETQLDEGLGSAPAKRKTTYPRDHPTDNPKPPKRTKAEIQEAAQQKKAADNAKKMATENQKKQKVLDDEERRKLSTQRIASVEDAVQRSQKNRQSHSERPDLKTMETYREKLQKKKDVERVANLQEDVDELEDDDMYMDDPVQFPPESAVDTDSSDGALLGLVEDEDDDELDEDAYNPPADGHEDDEDEGGGDASDDSMVLLSSNRQKRVEKKTKVRFFSAHRPSGKS